MSVPFERKICIVPGCGHWVYNSAIYCVSHSNYIQRYGRIPKRLIQNPNDYEVIDGVCHLKVYKVCKGGFIKKRMLVDLDDIEKVSPHRWFVTPLGHCETFIKGCHTYIHHLILRRPLHPEKLQFKNRDTFDNRKSNLDIYVPKYKTGNGTLMKRKYRGVYYRKPRNKYHVQISFKDGRKNFGHYECKHDAAERYNEVALKYFGSNAKLNQINREEK